MQKAKSKKQKTTIPKSKKHRTQIRAWEVIYNPPLTEAEASQKIISKPLGVYKLFLTTHVDGENSHTHCGIVLRDTPTKLYLETVNDYFKIDGHTCIAKPLAKNIPARGKGCYIKKLKQYYDYTRDESKHEGQTIKDTFFYRFNPEEAELIELDSVPVSEYVLYYLEEKKISDLKRIAKEATRKRRAQILMSWDKLTKLIYQHILIYKPEPEVKPLDTFKPEVVDFVKDAWKPDTCLVLKGATNAGKTELALSLMENITKQAPLFVNDLNHLTVKAPLQPIVFDDMNFGLISRVKGIALTDMTKDRQIRILFGYATIEAKTPKIFTTNEELEDFMPFDSHGAIDRRLSVVDVTHFGKLYSE